MERGLLRRPICCKHPIIVFVLLLFVTVVIESLLVTPAHGRDLVDKLHPECTGRNLLISPAPNQGLNNQIDLLVHSLYIGIITNRKICLRGFYPQFDNALTVPIDLIYDIDHIHEALRNSDIVARIVSRFPNDRFDYQSINRTVTSVDYLSPTVSIEDYKNSVCLLLKGDGAHGSRACPDNYKNIDIRAVEKNYQGIVQFLQRKDIAYIESLALTNGVPFVRTGYETPEDDVCINEIHKVIKFTSIFYTYANKFLLTSGIKPETPYTAIHLRLEDDAMMQYWTVNWYEYEEVPSVREAKLKFLWQKEEHDLFIVAQYLKTITTSVDSKTVLFASTGLKGSPKGDLMDFVVDLLKNHYPNFIVSSEYKQSFLNLALPAKGREILAIFDYIIASQASHFIGISMSTFSANAMRRTKHRHGIKDIQYGKGETRLHERAISAKVEAENALRGYRFSSVNTDNRTNAELLSVFAKHSFMFSIRDMGLPVNVPKTLQEINQTLSVHGICSGIQLVNFYRTSFYKSTRRRASRRLPFGESYPGIGLIGLIPEH